MSIKTGGAAFPMAAHSDDEKSRYHFTQQGMDLRDWFAGQALVSLLGSDPSRYDYSNDDELGKDVYGIADAMLKARGES